MQLWAEIALSVGMSVSVAAFLLWPSFTANKDTARRPPGTLKLTLENNGVVACSDPLNLWFPERLEPNFQDVVALFQHRFPDLTPAAFATTSEIEFVSPHPMDMGRLVVSPSDAGCIVTLNDAAHSLSDLHKLHQSALHGRALTTMLDAAPYPIWRVDQNNEISFGNAAFHNLSGHDPDQAKAISQTQFPIKPEPTRMKMTDDNPADTNWYDVTSIQDNLARLHYALDVSPLVKAEVAQRNFVQTLTKTFAQLSIGLAIFDKNRQLVLFNPALVDLTELPAEFLSARPNLLSVFDKLRDNRIMPEPKDYGHWREKLAVLVAASAEGTYTEVWNLPNGSTYRVSGRPHPDGAIAYLFEDISAEISLTRKFRYELDLMNSVFDTIDTAVAVFSTSGHLVLSNDAYGVLWGRVDETSLQEHTILDASKIWQTSCAPSPIWGDLRDFVLSLENRAEWEAEANHKSGRKYLCRVSPIGGSSTLVLFSEMYAAPSLAELNHLGISAE